MLGALHCNAAHLPCSACELHAHSACAGFPDFQGFQLVFTNQ